MFDMGDVTFGEHKSMHVFIAIPFIATQMLLRRWALNGDMNDQVIQRPFVMLVGSRNPGGQRSAALVHQKVNFTALLGSVSGIGSRVTPAQQDQLSAVIDFGCLGVGVPACDLIVAWNLISAETRDIFRAVLPVDDATWARGLGWALSVGQIARPYYQTTNPVLADHKANGC